MSDQHLVSETAEAHKQGDESNGDGFEPLPQQPPRPPVSPRMSKAYALFDELWREWCDRAEEDASTSFGFHCSHADSELECVFLAALMFMRPDYLSFGYGGPLGLGLPMKVIPQYPCGPYRIDFAVVVPAEGKFAEDIQIAVECDGQYFHDRTDKQAARDKKRDRFLTLNGWRVVRFVESEILKDPRGCADQVEELISEILDQQFRRAVERREAGE